MHPWGGGSSGQPWERHEQGRGAEGTPETDTGVGPTLTPAQMALPARPVPGPGGGLAERDVPF